MISERSATSVRELYPPTPRRILRHVVLNGLSWWFEARGLVGSYLDTPRVHMVYLHHVFPEEKNAFRELLGMLAQGHSFLSYGDAVERIQSGPVDRAYVAFSFDDGFESCLAAADILEDFGTTACFFVCPAIVGETDHERIASFCRDRLGVPPVDFLSWSHLEQLRARGHEIGGHTLSHRNLAALTRDDLVTEIGGSHEVLEHSLGPIQHFSWPFGVLRAFSEEAATTVFDAGYTSCASAIRGCHLPSDHQVEKLCVRREHIVASWPRRHVRWLMASSARRRLTDSKSCWPEDWSLDA